MPLRPVTDPDLIAELEGKKPVTDPRVLAQLKNQQEDTSLIQRLLIGAGRGFTDIREGIKQGGLRDLERGGIAPPGTAQAYTRNAEQERQFFERTPVGQSTASKVGRFAGNVVPYLAVPGAQGSLPARIGLESLLGGAIGGSQFTPEGQPRNVTTGALLGGGMTAGLGLLGRGIQSGRAALTAPYADDVVRLGQQHNVPVLAGDVAGPITAKVSTQAENVLGSGVVPARIKQAASAQTAAQRILDRQAAEVAVTKFGGQTGMKHLQTVAASDAPRSGAARQILEEVSNAGDDWDKIIQASGNLQSFRKKLIADRYYDRVAELAGNRPIETVQSLKALDHAIVSLGKSNLPDKPLVATLATLRKNLNKPQTYNQLRETRSAIGSLISDAYKGKNALVGERGVGFLQEVKDGVVKDLDTFGMTGGAAIKRAQVKADRFYQQNVTPLRDAQLAKVLKSADPDAIFPTFINQARNAKGRGTRLYNALDGKGRAAVRAGIVRQAFDKAYDAERNAFSPAKYSGEIGRMEKSINVFFKDAEKAEVEGFSRLMRHIERAGQVAENPPTGLRTAQLVSAGAQAGLASQGLPGVAGLIAGTGTLRVLFSTEQGRRILLGAAKSEPGSKAMTTFINQANKLITRASVVGATNE